MLQEMRQWLKENQWADVDNEDIDAMSFVEIFRGVDRHYAGGTVQFVIDSNHVPKIEYQSNDNCPL